MDGGRNEAGFKRPRPETGRVFETAPKVDADYRVKDAGETAIVQWLVETVDATEQQTIVIYGNGKVPNWIANRNMDAGIDVLTTRAFLDLAKRNEVIPSAAAVWVLSKRLLRPQIPEWLLINRRTRPSRT